MKMQALLLAFTLGFTSALPAADVSVLDLGETKLDADSAAMLSCGGLPVSTDFTIKDSGFKALPIVNPAQGASDEFQSQLAQDALSANGSVASAAIASLRAFGPDGLKVMLSAHAKLIKSHTSGGIGLQMNDKDWRRFKTALDAIARQRDSYASKLYWFTDLEQAKAAARQNNKPILSLRLLGNLDDDLSCANSRFFRTTLYANAQVSDYLRDHFILHWKSVRPVPKVTIDFGDGRKLERTITGNSIHYILDSGGQIIDALPGLYGAKPFLASLQKAEKTADDCAAASSEKRVQILHEYHCARVAAIEADWSRDLAIVRSSPSSATASAAQPSALLAGPPSALRASGATVSKTQIERPLLRSTFPDQPADRLQLEAATDDSTWACIAALHSEQARLDEVSRALLIAKAPSALTAGRLTASKRVIENPVLRQIRNLERSISEDTVRNEYLFHTKIHEWLATIPPAQNLDAFNSKVYAELFLTPDSDPWLGLVQPDICTALENNGLVSNAQ